MHDIASFGGAAFGWGLVAAAALLAQRAARIARVPAPAVFLIAAAIAATYVQAVRTAVGLHTVEDVVTLALVAILFDGGHHLGRRRFRAAAVPIAILGIAGTFATAALIGVLAHVVFGLAWSFAFVLGAALAPTDPAVVFALLASKQIEGRASAILEGESGFNDPAGIALLVGFVRLATHPHSSVAAVAGTFALSMALGCALGVLGGVVIHWLSKREQPTPQGSLLVMASVVALYGLTTIAHGSGFLAALVAGIVAGDDAASTSRPTEGRLDLPATLAALGELVAFVMLGITVNLHLVFALDVWPIGLALFALLTLVVRPIVTVPLLAGVRLSWRETGFVAWAGLKGAVPLLLGALAVTGMVAHASRLYAIVFVVVTLSVVVQGGTLPWVARLLRETTAR